MKHREQYVLIVIAVWLLGLFVLVSPDHPNPPWWYLAIAVLPFAAIPVLLISAAVLRRLGR